MVRFINPRTGRRYYYSQRTVDAGLIPKVLVRDRPEKKLQTFEVDDAAPKEPSREQEPSREEMMGFLREKEIKVSPNIGDEKLKQRYYENKE